MTSVLLTRPKAQSRAFAKQLADRFGNRLDYVISPVLKTVDLSPEFAFSTYAGVVFTSQNGVAAYQRMGGPSGLPAYCVGARTAQAASAIGLKAQAAGGTVAALNELLAQTQPGGPLLHPSGVHVAGQVVGDVTRVAVYDQVQVALTSEALQLLAQQTRLVVPLFSPRSAVAFQEALPADRRARLSAIALSGSVFEVLEPRHFDTISQCETPTAEAVLDKMADIFPV